MRPQRGSGAPSLAHPAPPATWLLEEEERPQHGWGRESQCVNAAGIPSVCKHCPNKFYRTDEAAGEWAPQSGGFLSFQDGNSETPQLLPSPSPSPLSLSGPCLRCLVSSLGPQGSPRQPQKGLYNSGIGLCSSPAYIPSMAPQCLQILSLVVETCMDPALSNSPPSPIPLPSDLGLLSHHFPPEAFIS